MLKRLCGLALLAALCVGLGSVTDPAGAQGGGDCRLYEDNHLCYDGTVGCRGAAVDYSSAGQSGIVAQYGCSVSSVAYLGVCDSGNEPQDDQFILSINNQVVSENVIDTASEYVKVYPITLPGGTYPVLLSVLRDSVPPGTYRVVASTSPSEVERQLSSVCGTDFAATTFEEEGSGRFITQPIPIVAYASYTKDNNGDGAMTSADNAGIFLYDAYRDSEVQLTDGYFDDDPAWSPDGQTIIFTADRRLPGETAIFTIPARGGTPTALTDGSVAYWQPEYSPDGREIAAACYTTSICLMNADGSNPHVILGMDGQDRYFWDPQWSPDGRQLLAVGRADDTNGNGYVDGCDQSALYVFNRDGSGLQRVTWGNYYVFGGDWSADGSCIIYYAAWETGNGYACAYNDEAALGVIDLSSGSETVLIPRGRFLRTPAFSSDASWATFTAPNRDDNGDGYLDARDSENLVVFNFADRTQRRLTYHEREVFDPAWAPPRVTSLPGR